MNRKRHTWKPKKFDPIEHRRKMAAAMVGPIPQGKWHSTVRGKKDYDRHEGKNTKE